MVFFNLSYSQSSQLDELHNVFAPLDKNRIPTGILSDYGVQLVSFTPFNGILSDSSYTNFDVWQMLYTGLYSSVIRSDIQMEGVNGLVERLKTTFTSNPSTVYITVISYNYSALNPDAAALGLINIQNEQLFDIPNKNPYLTKSLFAAAPSRTCAEGASIPFCFRNDMHLTNLTYAITRIDVDFGNGQGYKQVYFNTPYNALYTTSGEVIVRVKFTFTNGTTLFSHFKMNIEVPPSKSPTAYPYYTISPKTGVHSGGKLSWRLSNNNTSGKIKQPLIVAEGFDPMAILFNRNYSVDKFLNYIDYYVYPSGDINYRSLGFNLNLNNYDIVFLDYNDGVDDIFRNAKLLEEAIEWVNGQKSGIAGAQPNVVMGLSMGGLVAKIALRNMEQAGKNHDTRLFITVDTPHKGANIPVGIQALLRHLEDMSIYIWFPVPAEIYDLSNSVDIIGNAIKVLNSKAARQMLKYRVVLSNGALSYDNSEHDVFQQQYDAAGFPAQCRNVAISNGSISGLPIYTPGAEMVDLYKKEPINFFVSFISWVSLFTTHPELADIPFITYNSDLILDLNINSVPNRTVAKVYDGRIAIKKRILYIITKEINLTHKTLHSASSMLPFDGSPGGLSSLDVSNVGNIKPEYKAMLLNSIKQPDFAFIPVSSSLSVNTSNPLERLDNQNLIGTGKTPFASYYAQHSNEDHQQLTPSNSRYILNELSGVTCPTPFGSTMNGPYKFCTDGEYTVNYLSTCAAYSWSSSSNLQIVDGQGTAKAKFSIKTPGLSWIKANVSTPSGNISITKSSVTAGVSPPSITGPIDAQTYCAVAYPCIGAPYYYVGSSTVNQFSYYLWELYGEEEFPLEFSYSNRADFSISHEGQFTMSAQGYDAECGWSAPATHSFYGYFCGNYNLYGISPNPADDLLTLTELDTDVSAKFSASSNASMENRVRVNIYSWDGVLVRTKDFRSFEKSFQLNLSNLREAKYILHIFRNDKLIQVEQIIVKH